MQWDIDMFEQQPAQIQEQSQVLLRLRELLRDKDFEASEFVSGFAAFGWGIMLLLPYLSLWLGEPYIGGFSRSPTFKVMAEIAPEWVWGGAMVIAGAVQLVAAFCDYEAWACRINWRAVRYYTALLLIALWAFISITFIRANPGATSTAVYPIFAASDIWVYWRLHVLGRHGTQ